MTEQRCWGWFVVVAVCLGGQPAAQADMVTLTNGQQLEGIITQEAERQIELQVAWQSTLAFDRSEVATITRSSEWDNRRLQGRWREEGAEAQRRERARLTAIAARKAKARREALAQAETDTETAPATSGEPAATAARSQAKRSTARPATRGATAWRLPEWLSRTWSSAATTSATQHDQQ